MSKEFERHSSTSEQFSKLMDIRGIHELIRTQVPEASKDYCEAGESYRTVVFTTLFLWVSVPVF